MSDAYVIEIDSLSAGIVQRVRGGFRFYASHGDFFGLDGQRFATPWRAQRAAEEVMQELRVRQRKLSRQWTGSVQPRTIDHLDLAALDELAGIGTDQSS